MNEKMLTKEELAVRLNISAYDVDKLRKSKTKPHIILLKIRISYLKLF